MLIVFQNFDEMNQEFIFNIGLNRAGTTSLAKALEKLGYSTLHYRFGKTRLYDIMRQNARKGHKLLTGLDERYHAFSDFAGHNFYRQLDKQYPGSKFILTLREMEAWLNSREWKANKNRNNPNYRYVFKESDRDGWRHWRESYVAEVKKYFQQRPSDFTIIDIPNGDSWPELCSFLRRPVPKISFPNINAGAGKTEDNL